MLHFYSLPRLDGTFRTISFIGPKPKAIDDDSHSSEQIDLIHKAMAFTTSEINNPIAMNGSHAVPEKVQPNNGLSSGGPNGINGKIETNNKARPERYTPQRRKSLSRRSRSRDRNAVTNKKVESDDDEERSAGSAGSGDNDNNNSRNKPERERYTPQRRRSISGGRRGRSLSQDRLVAATINSKTDQEGGEIDDQGGEEQSASSKSTARSTPRRRLKKSIVENSGGGAAAEEEESVLLSPKSERKKERKEKRKKRLNNKKRGPDVSSSLEEYVVPKGPRPISPERQAVISTIEGDIKTLEEEIAQLEKQFEEDQNRFVADVKAAKVKGREVQRKKLKGLGGESIPIDELLQQGFDPLAVEEHLNEENKKLVSRIEKYERDINNTRTNISKLVDLNVQSENAVRAAMGAQRSLVVKETMNEELVRIAEKQLQSVERTVRDRNTQGDTETQKKEITKDTIKAILRKVQSKCTDPILVADVLQTASVVLANELGISSDDEDESSSSSDDDESFIVGFQKDENDKDDDDADSESSDSACEAEDEDDESESENDGEDDEVDDERKSDQQNVDDEDDASVSSASSVDVSDSEREFNF